MRKLYIKIEASDVDHFILLGLKINCVFALTCP